jgi:hypothetical protein
MQIHLNEAFLILVLIALNLTLFSHYLLIMVGIALQSKVKGQEEYDER